MREFNNKCRILQPFYPALKISRGTALFIPAGNSFIA